MLLVHTCIEPPSGRCQIFGVVSIVLYIVLYCACSGSPRRSQGAGGKGQQQQQQRPKSEDVSRFNGQHDDPRSMGPPPAGIYSNVQRPINQQHGARSSPALASKLAHCMGQDISLIKPDEWLHAGLYALHGI